MRSYSFFVSLGLLTVLTLGFVQTAQANDLTGTWTLTIDTPRGVQHPTLVVEQSGDGLSGVYNSLRGPIEVPEITFDGTNFSFPLVITVPIGQIEVDYRGVIDGDAMQGLVKNPRGEVPFKGQRGTP